MPLRIIVSRVQSGWSGPGTAVRRPFGSTRAVRSVGRMSLLSSGGANCVILISSTVADSFSAETAARRQRRFSQLFEGLQNITLRHRMAAFGISGSTPIAYYGDVASGNRRSPLVSRVSYIYFVVVACVERK